MVEARRRGLAVGSGGGMVNGKRSFQPFKTEHEAKSFRRKLRIKAAEMNPVMLSDAGPARHTNCAGGAGLDQWASNLVERNNRRRLETTLGYERRFNPYLQINGAARLRLEWPATRARLLRKFFRAPSAITR